MLSDRHADLCHEVRRKTLLRLSACVLIETHDEWQVSDRRYLSEASMAALTPPAPAMLEPRHDTPQEVIDNPNLKTA